MANAKEKLGEITIVVTDNPGGDHSIPFDISLKTAGKMDTRTGLIVLISSIGMIVEDTIRTGMTSAYKDVSSDEEIAELQDLVLGPLMDLLGSQLGMIENSLAYILTQVDEKDPQIIRDLFEEIEEPENAEVEDDGAESE